VKFIIRFGTIIPFIFGIFLGASSIVHADDVPVSATIISYSISAPILISPAASASSNTSSPSFSWQRPTPLTGDPFKHYDLYIDDAMFASSVPDSLISQDYYFYSATASAGIFTVTLKTALAQGYHTWKVVVFTNDGLSATSETRTFYVDSVPPFISLTKVNTQTLNWTTLDPSTFPGTRSLTIYTSEVTLTGGVEISANFQIILVCPSNIPTCTNQTYTGNIPTGLWEASFSNLIAGYTYTVKISATDAATNYTIFPDFFITYVTSSGFITTPTPTPLITSTATTSGALITPTVSPSPSLTLPSTALTPPIQQANIIVPTTILPSAPPAPTPPPPKAPVSAKRAIDLFYSFLLILMIFGLPLHLLMTVFGSATPLKFILKLLLILAFPFLRKRAYQSAPFTFIDIYIPDKLDRVWQSVVSDINGFFNLKSPIPQNLFIKISCRGRLWKNNLLKGFIIPIGCLIPLLVSPQNDRTRLQKRIYDLRIIPLIVALLTGTGAMIIKPSYFVLIYLYLSLQYLYSEYFYPKF